MTEERKAVDYAPDGSEFARHHWYAIALLTVLRSTGQQGMIQSLLSSPPTCPCGKCERPAEDEVVQAMAQDVMSRNPDVDVIGGTALYMTDMWQIKPYDSPDNMFVMDGEGFPLSKKELH